MSLPSVGNAGASPVPRSRPGELLTYGHLFLRPANDLPKHTRRSSSSCAFQILVGGPGGHLGSVLRDLTGHVNESRIRIYLGIYLFRGECRGRVSLVEEGQRRGRAAGRRAPSRLLPSGRSGTVCGLFCGDCIRLLSRGQADKRRKKN